MWRATLHPEPHPMYVPPWYYHLPLAPGGKRALIVDNAFVSAYVVRGSTEPDACFVFESGRVQIQVGRQVIDEALNHPDLDPDRRAVAAEAIAELQRRGTLVVSGASRMTGPMMRAYHELAVLLRVTLSAPDAFVLADAVMNGIPLLSLDRRASSGLEKALRNPPVQRFLVARQLRHAVSDIFVG